MKMSLCLQLESSSFVIKFFCSSRMASSMFKINRDQFKTQVDKLTQSINKVDDTEGTFK